MFGMRNQRSSVRYHPYRATSQEKFFYLPYKKPKYVSKGDKLEDYLHDKIADHRRDWVRRNVKNELNRNAYDASQAAYGTAKSIERLKKIGYTRDEELSGDNTVVYTNLDTKHTFVAYRGTQEFRDYLADTQLAVGNYNGSEFKAAYDSYEKALKKYKENITVTGHSLGGTKAIKTADMFGSEAIVFNPGTGVFGLDTGRHTTFQNTDDLISSRVFGDAVVQTPGGHSLNNYESLFYYE